MRINRMVQIGILTFLSGLLVSTDGQAIERTVKAMATWQAQGLISHVETDKALLVGALVGAMFTEEGIGELDTAGLLCPTTVETDLNTGDRIASGRCVITDKEEDKIFAKWSCRGNEKGCQGSFTLIGGTGKFVGISGESSVIFRIAMRALGGAVAKDSFQQVAAGLVLWPAFHYKLPYKRS